MTEDRRWAWLLRAANGRVLARSAGGFADARTCAAHVRAFSAALLAREPRLLPVSGGWAWVVLDSAGQPFARSYRGYSRRSQAEKSGRHFLEVVTRTDPVLVD